MGPVTATELFTEEELIHPLSQSFLSTLATLMWQRASADKGGVARKGLATMMGPRSWMNVQVASRGMSILFYYVNRQSSWTNILCTINTISTISESDCPLPHTSLSPTVKLHSDDSFIRSAILSQNCSMSKKQAAFHHSSLPSSLAPQFLYSSITSPSAIISNALFSASSANSFGTGTC